MDKKTSKLKNLLKKAERTDPSKIKDEAIDFLKTINAAELIEAEQSLIDSGVEPEAMRHLCTAHIELMKDQLGIVRDQLPETHPINTLMAEHDEILEFLAQLEELNQKVLKLEKAEGLDKVEIAKLKHIAHHLEAAEKHHQREEDVLFPEMEKRGVHGPTKVMRLEHIGLREAKKTLEKLANGNTATNSEKFKEKLNETTDYLVFNLRDHIFKENNILYPAALEVITDEKVWSEIKKKCDNIGYCCFTPKDVVSIA